MKNGYNVIVNTGDIKNKQSLINKKYDELYEMVKTYQKMIDETEAIYDTNSGKEFRLVAHRYLDIVLLYLNNDFKEYANKLNSILDVYGDFYNVTGITVGKSDNDEV